MKKPNEIRIGNVKAVVFKDQYNQINVKFEKIYKDKKDNWKSTPYFKKKELLLLSQVAKKTFLES